MFVETKREGEAAPDLGTLRVDRVLALANEIEHPTLGLGFDMSQCCGTACCIGGHADVMFCGSAGWFATIKENPLGLTATQTSQLYMPPGFSFADFTRAQGARTLRHLAATGKVDWEI